MVLPVSDWIPAQPAALLQGTVTNFWKEIDGVYLYYV